MSQKQNWRELRRNQEPEHRNLVGNGHGNRADYDVSESLVRRESGGVRRRARNWQRRLRISQNFADSQFTGKEAASPPPPSSPPSPSDTAVFAMHRRHPRTTQLRSRSFSMATTYVQRVTRVPITLSTTISVVSSLGVHKWAIRPPTGSAACGLNTLLLECMQSVVKRTVTDPDARKSETIISEPNYGDRMSGLYALVPELAVSLLILGCIICSISGQLPEPMIILSGRSFSRSQAEYVLDLLQEGPSAFTRGQDQTHSRPQDNGRISELSVLYTFKSKVQSPVFFMIRTISDHYNSTDVTEQTSDLNYRSSGFPALVDELRASDLGSPQVNLNQPEYDRLRRKFQELKPRHTSSSAEHSSNPFPV
nr:hypothetical protein Iba_chr07bCG5900 [Ipomoea batatas]